MEQLNTGWLFQTKVLVVLGILFLLLVSTCFVYCSDLMHVKIFVQNWRDCCIYVGSSLQQFVIKSETSTQPFPALQYSTKYDISYMWRLHQCTININGNDFFRLRQLIRCGEHFAPRLVGCVARFQSQMIDEPAGFGDGRLFVCWH